MYCSTCGSPIAPGLSFCNRCGANLKDRSSNQNMGPISAFLTAITIIGVAGLGIMFGGTVVLREENLPIQLIGFFMLFVFLLVGTIELMLIRQLSRLTGSAADPRSLPAPHQPMHELRPASINPVNEPVSVTDNTTRTLEYSRREQ